jgi:antitoxin (DNA-binding transcriptional repressor) of toxin-antitoxin stability system
MMTSRAGFGLGKARILRHGRWRVAEIGGQREGKSAYAFRTNGVEAGSEAHYYRRNLHRNYFSTMLDMQNLIGPQMAVSAKDLIPLSLASTCLSELVDEVRNGTEKILTEDGERCAALISAERLDAFHRMERALIQLQTLHDVKAGLADIAAGRTIEARAAIARIRARRAAEPAESGEGDRD